MNKNKDLDSKFICDVNERIRLKRIKLNNKILYYDGED